MVLLSTGLLWHRQAVPADLPRVELVQAVGLVQSTVSKHLACLRECGLIDVLAAAQIVLEAPRGELPRGQTAERPIWRDVCCAFDFRPERGLPIALEATIGPALSPIRSSQRTHHPCPTTRRPLRWLCPPTSRRVRGYGAWGRAWA